MIFRERARFRVRCEDFDAVYDDLTDYIVVKLEKAKHGYVATLLKKKLKR